MKKKIMKILCKTSFVLFTTALTFIACAQDHQSNKQKLTEEKNIERNTYLLNNQQNIIPLQALDERKVASVNLGFSFAASFDSLLNKYTKVSSFTATSYHSDSLNLDDLSGDLKFYNTVIVQLTDKSINNPENLSFIADIHKSKQVIVCLYGNSGLEKLDSYNFPIIFSNNNSSIAAEVTAQLIFGGIAANSTLVKNGSAKQRAGAGFKTTQTRLKYTVPEDAGINTSYLKEIDDIAAEAIRERAAPSIVVLIAKDGKVIFNKAYGYHTYEKEFPTKIDDIYDLASITKVSATTPAVMRLYEQEKLKLDTNVGAYIPKARKTDKNNIQVREVMLHQAGFVSYIPFYQKIQPKDFSRDSSAAYPVKVADSYYMRKNYFEDVMWPEMLNSPVKTRGKYVYSDLSMYFMQQMIERQSGEREENYVQKNFYKPLGMQTAGFLPRNRFDRNRIIPTENDTYFRKTLLQGYVHDQGAAMAGGVAGHAGNFGSANDLVILFQTFLNRGNYGGTHYFKPETVDMFTSKQSNVSRRGLGFDRWDPDRTNRYPSDLASPQTYGHTGYTGTCVWVDPTYNLVYVFLSNRVYPEVASKLSTSRIRPRIQDVIYEAIKKSEQ